MWWKELRKNAMAQVSLVFVVVIIAAALFVPFFELLDAESPNYRVRNQPPVLAEGGSWAYPLGTDYHGRNILARILYGARISLFIAFVAVSLSTLIGVLVGLIAGYYGGRLDDVIMRGVDALISIPSILLTIAMMTLLQPGVLNLAIIIGLSNWVWQARTTRSKILSLREEPYILAAKISEPCPVPTSEAGQILLRPPPPIVPPTRFDGHPEVVVAPVLGFAVVKRMMRVPSPWRTAR